MLKINGKPISRMELDRSVKALLSQGRNAKEVSPEAMKKAEDAVLEQLANSELLYQAAQAAELKDLEKEVEQQMVLNRGKFASEAEYQAALAGLQMTAKEVEEFTRRDIAISKLMAKQFADKAQVSDDEARKFYDDNRAKYFEKGERVRASHILIGVKETALPEERKQAREKAEAILKRIKGGDDFVAQAKIQSSCPSASKGGDLGQFGKGEMVAPFEKAAFALKPGELSEVVETQFGFHVIKVTEKIPAATQKFEEVKEKIVEYLKREKIGAQLPAYINELRGKAKIEKG